MRRFLLLLSPVILLAAFLKLHTGHVSAQSRPVTWRDQVAPIVYANCTACHHVGGSGPFDLTTYASARRWGPQIADVVQSRFMPPWLPEPTSGPVPVHFQNDRRLKESDIATLIDWVKAGMPEGAGPEPKPPTYQSGWQMGPPDLILEMPVAVTEPASGTDLFVNFILPTSLKETRWIRALEIQPAAGQLVHHANLIIDRTASLRAAHPSDWQQGIPGMDLTIDSGDTFDPDSHFLFWKPDSTALVEPPGMPWRLDPGDDLILNMHLKPTGKPEQLKARVGLYFASAPAAKRPMLLQLEHDAALNIPAGDSNFVVTDTLTLPIAVDLLGVYPHAHYLGHQMEAWATLPDGQKQPILLIRNWDINRQAVYQLQKPLTLPKGTVLHMRYTYDNSAANVHNPHSPPIPVRAGNRATDEMGHLWLQVLPHDDGPGDPRIPLERAWMENILRKSPNDPLALYNMGALSQMDGQPQQAEVFYRRLLTQHPHDPRVLTALGSALETTGDTAAARSQFTAALAADPANNDGLYDLAILDLHDGQSATAEHRFRQLLSQKPADLAAVKGLAQALLDQDRGPEAQSVLEGSITQGADDAEFHHLLAMAYAASGQTSKTIDELRRWAALTPGQPDAHRALAQVLAASGSVDEGIAEQEIVVHLTSANAGDWNDLGTLDARAGRRAQAQQAFERALHLDPHNQIIQANLDRLAASHPAPQP